MAARARRKSARVDTELAVGDLLVWTTEHGKLLVWVINVIEQSLGTVPLLEVLGWLGEVVPAHPERLEAALSAGASRLWFLPTDLKAAHDPAGAYVRIRTGFARSTFAPSRDSQYGLNTPYILRAWMAAEITKYARSLTAGGKADEDDAAAASAARAKARAAAARAAKTLTSKRVPPWVMTKPKAPGSQSVCLSLTGRNSHTVWFAPGFGSLAIGPRRAPRGAPQALVGADEKLHWDGLDEIPRTGGGSAMPRWLRYEGSDTGIFAWLARREDPLEKLDLCATAPTRSDVSDARIGDLVIDTQHRVAVELVLGRDVRVMVRGEPSLVRLTTKDGATITPRVAPPPKLEPMTFEGWEITRAGLKVANAALVEARRALGRLTKADKKQARAIVTSLVDALNVVNASKGNTLLTSEREDVAMAVRELFSSALLAPLSDNACEWLDERRDF